MLAHLFANKNPSHRVHLHGSSPQSKRYQTIGYVLTSLEWPQIETAKKNLRALPDLRHKSFTSTRVSRAPPTHNGLYRLEASASCRWRRKAPIPQASCSSATDAGLSCEGNKSSRTTNSSAYTTTFSTSSSCTWWSDISYQGTAISYQV